MADRVVLDQAAIDSLLNSTRGPVAAEMLRRATKVRTTAIRLCPVDTGRLRASIAQELATDSEGLLARVGTDVEYAAHIEFGTSRMRPQPFLRPALDAAR